MWRCQRTEPITGDPATYHVLHLDRWRSRETARIPATVATVWRQITVMHQRNEFERTGRGDRVEPPIQLVVDQTGVGPFGTTPLREAGFDPLGIVIHGGDAVSHPEPSVYRVPKRDLAGAVNTLLQARRLSIPTGLRAGEGGEDLSAALKAELQNFRAKITLGGHDTYGAGSGEEWRVGAHDDLVLSVAVAAWLGEAHPTPRLDPVVANSWTDLPR
jgi:hypothetical protein